MPDRLLTMSEAAKEFPKVKGKRRSPDRVRIWCERAGLIAVEAPKQVWRSDLLLWAEETGKLPRPVK